jgi:hypothetical protein
MVLASTGLPTVAVTLRFICGCDVGGTVGYRPLPTGIATDFLVVWIVTCTIALGG